MIAFIFVGIPLICIIALIVMGCSGGNKTPGYKGTTVFLDDKDELDDYPGGIRMADGSIMTDDDDYVDEFGEDVL